ncbi:MAG: tetratricopeptide repeat protein, partial [Myxococcota bacterium]
MRVNLIFAALTLSPAVAFAQASDLDLAKQNFRTGQSYYERGEFEKALAAFDEADRLAPGNPDLHYNIAQTCERLLLFDRALASYRTYLAGKPEAPDRKFVENRIVFLEKQTAPAPVAAPQPPPSPAAPPPAAPPPEPQPAPAAEPAPAPAPEAATASSSEGGGGQRVAGWISLGVGVVALGAGVAFGLIAKAKAQEVEEAAAAGEEFDSGLADTESAGQQAEKFAIVGLAVGGVGIIVGTVLLLTSGGDDAHVSAGPSSFAVRF